MNKKMGLVKGRHEISEITEYIFDNTIEELFNYRQMDKIIHQKLADCEILNLYVTGLTVALIQVINYCIMQEIKLTLYHFDRDTNSYQRQNVMTTIDKDIRMLEDVVKKKGIGDNMEFGMHKESRLEDVNQANKLLDQYFDTLNLPIKTKDLSDEQKMKVITHIINKQIEKISEEL